MKIDLTLSERQALARGRCSPECGYHGSEADWGWRCVCGFLTGRKKLGVVMAGTPDSRDVQAAQRVIEQKGLA